MAAAPNPTAPDPAKQRTRQYLFGSAREGASGGFAAFAGGGCGAAIWSSAPRRL